MTLSHKKFSKLLQRWLDSESLGVAAAAWVIGCHPNTMAAWLKGDRYPSRDYAITLGWFSDELARYFESLAAVTSAGNRLQESRKAAA